MEHLSQHFSDQRWVDFARGVQKQIRLQLAAVLRAIVSQRLVRRSDSEGRVPAVEVMVSTSYIRECILVPEKTRAIREAISSGTSQYGMQTFDQSLWDLFPAGLVNYETALESAADADEFKLRMQGIARTGPPFFSRINSKRLRHSHKMHRHFGHLIWRKGRCPALQIPKTLVVTWQFFAHIHKGEIHEPASS